jgi:hypothetical protein
MTPISHRDNTETSNTGTKLDDGKPEAKERLGPFMTGNLIGPLAGAKGDWGPRHCHHRWLGYVIRAEAFSDQKHGVRGLLGSTDPALLRMETH